MGKQFAHTTPFATLLFASIACSLFWWWPRGGTVSEDASRLGTPSGDLVFVHPRDEDKWSRHLAEGSRLDIRIGGSESSVDPADETDLVVSMESLGPLDADLQGALRTQSVRMLEEYRKRIEELAPVSAAGDAKAFAELSGLYGHELRAIAEIELLDTQGYWVLPHSAGGVPKEVSRAFDGSFGYREDSGDGRYLLRDGKRVILVFPFSRARFPTYFEVKRQARADERFSATELAREFNALPEDRRLMFGRILDEPGLVGTELKEHASFYERYLLASLGFDRSNSTMFVR